MIRHIQRYASESKSHFVNSAHPNFRVFALFLLDSGWHLAENLLVLVAMSAELLLHVLLDSAHKGIGISIYPP